MLPTGLYPLRTIVGDSVPVLTNKGGPAVRVVEQTPDAKAIGLEFAFAARPDFDAAVGDNSYYERFLPVREGGVRRPGPGMATYPRFTTPFPFSAPFVSLSALATRPADARASRKLAVTLSITLEHARIIGGIFFRGFPSLQTRLLASGESTANFGLPREISVTAGGYEIAQAAQLEWNYPDADVSVTRQEIISHSGLQFICCEIGRAHV